MMKRLMILVFLLTAFAAQAAEPPRTLSFQGTLADDNGHPLSDGVYDLQFKIWKTAAGGSWSWGENISVELNGGVFSTILGHSSPINLDFAEPYWLGIAVEGDPELMPRTALTSVPYAMNVVAGAALSSLNGLTDEVQLVAGSNISIITSGNNLHISATGSLSDNDWSISGVDMSSMVSGNVGIGVPDPDTKLHVEGDIIAGDNSSAMIMARNGNGHASIFGGDTGNRGAEMRLVDEVGVSYMGFQPDIGDVGGYFWVNDGANNQGFVVDGNSGADGNVLIRMQGLSDVIFDMGETENAAVQLPASSIGAPEITDEPGVASQIAHGGSSFVLTNSYSPIISRTITAPTDGYLLVLSSYEIDLRHEAPGASYVTAGISLSPNSISSSQDYSFYQPTDAPVGLYLNSSSPTAVFEVEAGSHTVYVVGQRNGTSASYIWDAHLNVVFIPTSYGVVAKTAGVETVAQENNSSVSARLTAGDIAQEQRDSNQANDERMAREIETLRAEVEALKQSMNGNEAN